MTYYNLICLDAGGDCKYAEFIPAYKSYGRNLPDNCQGVVFPGDEAHVDCSFSGKECREDLCPILKKEGAFDENAIECEEE